MDPVYSVFISCLLIGLLVGTLAGMLGIGGGLIIVPLLSYMLVHWLGLATDAAMPVAVATSLSTIIFTGMSSAWAHFRLGNLNSFIVLWSCLGVAAGGTVGALVASSISGHTLKNIFAVLVLVIAAKMIFGRNWVSGNTAARPALVTVGGFTGFFSALMGIGGGALMVPALVWFQVNLRQAIGCAAMGGVILALFGTASFIVAGWDRIDVLDGAIGYVYLPATLGIVTTSIFTAALGARLGQKINTKLLKRLFAGLLVLVSVRMILGIE
ncbi:sulfite exporter TauE/SafE family protein [Alteromonas aestuariivivens]|uniref:Probable membrane transporter protein n=1 Tax=Alteromonas aestuariivivens TaxID=1938339 RepID=A0A3D8MCE0_9ALTE|nr:sulfite exporter TauE/SafE family protein [Alteromonas aestuariivivens]RDV27955.1 sulfite exporter TauE/SafE family protein [Alteromonas aestuariivivens]